MKKYFCISVCFAAVLVGGCTAQTVENHVSSNPSPTSVSSEPIPANISAPTEVQATSPAPLLTQESYNTEITSSENNQISPKDPPKQERTLQNIFDYKGLVELSELDPSFVIDCKYATVDNFTHEQQYPFPLVLVQKDVAIMLLKAQELAKMDGLHIKIFDTYRPLSVQKKLYDATPETLRIFVAKPSNKETHAKGISIDCSLVDKDGNELSMPSGFDEFNDSAFIDYEGGTAEQRENRDYLIKLMTSCGFTVYSKEWWHYNAPNQGNYEALDILFEEYIKLRNVFYESQP